MTIDFDIPGDGVHRITVTRDLPNVFNPSFPITIDGWSQPGSEVNDPIADDARWTIELAATPDASSSDTSFEGLRLVGPKDTVRGLDSHGFFRDVEMLSSTSDRGKSVVVIGLHPDGGYDPSYLGAATDEHCVLVDRWATRSASPASPIAM